MPTTFDIFSSLVDIHEIEYALQKHIKDDLDIISADIEQINSDIINEGNRVGTLSSNCNDAEIEIQDLSNEFENIVSTHATKEKLSSYLTGEFSELTSNMYVADSDIEQTLIDDIDLSESGYIEASSNILTSYVTKNAIRAFATGHYLDANSRKFSALC